MANNLFFPKDKFYMNKLNKIERERTISLPEIYRRFYETCSFTIPKNLVGTDLLNNTSDNLNDHAAELLEENGVENFLDNMDFVFMMHQGYIFWYFNANGDNDPIVYAYYDGKLSPDNLGRLSTFLKEYAGID